MNFDHVSNTGIENLETSMTQSMPSTKDKFLIATENSKSSGSFDTEDKVEVEGHFTFSSKKRKILTFHQTLKKYIMNPTLMVAMKRTKTLKLVCKPYTSNTLMSSFTMDAQLTKLVMCHPIATNNWFIMHIWAMMIK